MKIKNLERFKRKLRSLPKLVRDDMRSALEKSANEIVNLMKRSVPVDEGKLQASIGWTWGAPPDGAMAIAKVFQQAAGAEGLVITIYAGDRSTVVTNKRGVEFQNAILQEFGTKDMTANPYFRTSIRLTKKRVQGRMSRTIGKAARKIAAGGQ